MKAYKATYNGTCKTITFEEGKTYTFNGKLEMCRTGFHFCENPQDTRRWYNYEKKFKLMEIEVLGEVIRDIDKSITNKFKVIRFLSDEETSTLLGISLHPNGKIAWRKLPYIATCKTPEYDVEEFFDDHGNPTYKKYSNGITVNCEYKYDDHGRMIYKKDSRGIEHTWEYKYDDHGNVIYKKDSRGDEFTWEYKYNDSGKLVYLKAGDVGTEYQYNENGVLICESSRFHIRKYDEHGNIIYSEEIGSHIHRWEYKYDENGVMTYQKLPDKTVSYFDNHGNMIRREFPDGTTIHNEFKYDENGRIIYYKDAEGDELFKTYDQKGNLIYFKDKCVEWSITIQ